MQTIVLTPRVINTINSLPAKDREPISRALAADLILGSDPASSLTGVQMMLYSIIRFYVKQDMEREAASDGCQLAI